MDRSLRDKPEFRFRSDSPDYIPLEGLHRMFIPIGRVKGRGRELPGGALCPKLNAQSTFLSTYLAGGSITDLSR